MNKISSRTPLFKGFSPASLLLNALLILPPAFLYSMKVDMPHIFLIPAGLLVICFLKRNYLPYTDRPIIYCATAALILAVVPDMIVTVDETRFGLFDLMLRSSLVVPLLLYTASLSCFFAPNPYRTGLTAAFALAAMLVCGDIFNSRDLSNTLLAFLDEALRRYRTTYTAAALIQAMLLPYYFCQSSRIIPVGKTNVRNIVRLRFLLQLLCILLIPVFAFGASKLYYANARFFRHLELYFLRIGMRQAQNREMMLLSSSVNLRATLHPNLRQNPEKVLIRARSETPPGYLRGGVYTSYQHGRWTAESSSTELQAIRRANILSDSTFTIRNYPGAPATVPDNPRAALEPPLRRIELYFDGLLTRGTIPAPGNTYRLDAVADGAEVSESGIFQLKQWKRDGGCTVFTTNTFPQAAFQEPKPDDKLFGELTHLPDSLRQPMAEMASRILSGKTIRKSREKTDAVISFLNRHYRYSLDFQPPPWRKSDPVLHFLSRERKGHCELFASSAALLLRAMGLPTRYVTGLVCEKKHPYSRYYIARAADVHAWCEAWLPDEKQWVTVEATPYSNDNPLFRSQRERSPLSALFDLLTQTFQQAFADIRRGYFADAVLTLIESAFLFMSRLIRHPAGLLLIAGVLLFLLHRKLRGRKNRSAATARTPRETRQLASVFAAFEKHLAGKTRRKRLPAQTLQDFYADAPAEIRSLISEYEAMRYRETPPEKQQISDFERKCRNLLKQIREKEISQET